ncbi:ATP-binding cassette domain-containing protein [Paenibacillus elgii]|uniref:ATP-binding cassette domain-containing protein n=1 Tax=Paenibacillus elgii TaxID=189691 RepID=UPI00203D9791|nr:ATP-binding cassette domain-containing protein [Paenibacillus elgii]MCM3273127.1 ATP-binding cassette domain-containing protein [Paenibacillus elgii]
MKSFAYTIRCAGQAFCKVYRFNRPIVLLSLFVYIIVALQSNIGIYLSKRIVDQLSENNLYLLLGSIALLLSFQLVRLLLETYSQLKNRRMHMAFAVHCENELVDLVARTELLDKEHPQFTGDFSYWSFINGKYLESYSTVTGLVKQGLVAAVSLGYLLYYHLYIGLLALLVGTLKGIYDLRAVRRRVAINEEMMRQSRGYHYYFDVLTGSQTQKEMTLFQLVPYFRQKWLRKKDEANALSMQLETLNLKRQASGELLSIISSGIVIVITALLIYKGSLTIGDYVAITMALTMAESNITMMFASISRLTENAAHIERLNKIESDVHAAARLPEQVEPRPFRFQDELQIRNLTFRYPNRDEPVLTDINAEICKGEMIAILGENGSGKSTLIKLLLGLYRSDTDAILYDGVSVRTMDRIGMWRKTSAVFQDYIRYMTDVRDNIAVGNIAEAHNTDKLLSVLAKVGLSKTFKQGLDTKLGTLEDNAVNLSGGQWQRLALSRVFVSEEHELVVFDEPTSALDPVSEVRLMNEMLEHCRGKTVIMVSHRVGIARRADRIFVMEGGRIAEAGTHDELLHKQGLYHEMWHQQKQWYD